jgi:hypothetical protein
MTAAILYVPCIIKFFVPIIKTRHAIVGGMFGEVLLNLMIFFDSRREAKRKKKELPVFKNAAP